MTSRHIQSLFAFWHKVGNVVMLEKPQGVDKFFVHRFTFSTPFLASITTNEGNHKQQFIKTDAEVRKTCVGTKKKTTGN